MTWLLAILLSAAVAVIIFLVLCMMKMEEQRAKARDIDHAKCLAFIAHYVGNHFAAEVLRAAADDYNRPSTQTELAVIVREQWMTAGPNVPSIWMTNRADALEKEVAP